MPREPPIKVACYHRTNREENIDVSQTRMIVLEYSSYELSPEVTP